MSLAWTLNPPVSASKCWDVKYTLPHLLKNSFYGIYVSIFDHEIDVPLIINDSSILIRVSIVVKRHHSHGNSYEENI